MPKVNLIAERRKREKRQAATERGMVYSCGGLAALFLGLLVTTNIQIRTQQHNISAAESEMSGLKPLIAQVQGVQGQIDVLEPKLNLLQDSKNSTLHWYLVFQQIGQGLPMSSWLDTLGITRDDKTKVDSVTLNGQSLTADTVAATITQLQIQPLVSQVDLHFVNEDAAASPTDTKPHYVHFETVVQLKPQEQKPEAKDAQANH